MHYLEYSLQLIDSPIVEVSGFAASGYWAPHTPWRGDTNEDEAFSVTRFKSGQWLTLMVSQLDSNPKRGAVEITGTRGTYILDPARWQIIRHRGGRTITTCGPNPPSQWWRFYRNISDHLTKGTPLVITAQWARRPVHILDLANRSATKGVAMKARYG